MREETRGFVLKKWQQSVASSKGLLNIEFCIQTNMLPWCNWNMAPHFSHCNKQPSDKCAVSHRLTNAQRNTLIWCTLCRRARTLADEHWRIETDRKGRAQGAIDKMTEILKQTRLQNIAHFLPLTKQLRQIALTALHLAKQWDFFNVPGLAGIDFTCERVSTAEHRLCEDYITGCGASCVWPHTLDTDMSFMVELLGLFRNIHVH